MVQLLLDKSVDVNIRNDHGETALHEAARTGNKEIVELLFNQDPTAIDNMTAFGDTSLHNAAVNGHLEIVEYLLNKGVKINTRNSCSETPLYLASGVGNEAVVKFLLGKGANIGARSYNGNTLILLQRTEKRK